MWRWGARASRVAQQREEESGELGEVGVRAAGTGGEAAVEVERVALRVVHGDAAGQAVREDRAVDERLEVPRQPRLLVRAVLARVEVHGEACAWERRASEEEDGQQPGARAEHGEGHGERACCGEAEQSEHGDDVETCVAGCRL